MGAQADLYLEERRQAILTDLAAKRRVSVAELSRRFGVSEVTIRTDLQALAEQDLLVRTHGGAVPAGNGAGQLALALRRNQQVQEKSRIGQAGAHLVADGDAIFLDSSSTSLAIAHYLKQHRHITVVTNSLAVAQELLDAPGVTVVMVGGTVQKETASLIGREGLAAVDGYNLRMGFFGAHGLDPVAGLTDVSPEVAEIKRPLASRCDRVIAVVDATKWGRVGVASFTAVEGIHTIITDTDAPADAVAQCRARGISVIMV